MAKNMSNWVSSTARRRWEQRGAGECSSFRLGVIMMTLLLAALAVATPVVGVRVEVQPLGRGNVGTVVGIALQIAPEDRARVGARALVEISLVARGEVADVHSAVVELALDGSALLYREWPVGEGEVRLTVRSLDGSVGGAWSGSVVVTEEQHPFTPEAGAPPDATALAVLPAAPALVRFRPPPRTGGVGALLLELDAPPETDRVEFFQNDQLLFERNRPPWSVSVTLGNVAVRTVVRGVAWSHDGRYIGEDAVVLNAPSGTIPVSVLLAPEGKEEGHRTVTVAVGKHGGVDVELRGDDRLLGRWSSCPCVVRIPTAELAAIRVLAATARAGADERGEAVLVLGSAGFVDEIRVEQVELAVVVLDGGGAPVATLGPDDFTVFEDEQAVEIVGFSRTSDLPLSLGLAVDTSGSMRESFAAVRVAIAGFATELLRPGDAVFLSTFNFDAQVLVPWTREVQAVTDALRTTIPEGGTSLHDALVTSLEEFRSRRGRTALVLLTDGEDTTSRTSWDVTSRFVRTMRVPIFPIGFQVGWLDLGTRNRLQALARDTGGQAFFAPKSGDLRAAYAAIAAQLRSQYLLSYRSPSRKGENEFRSVRVVVKGEGLVPRTISGYYPGR